MMDHLPVLQVVVPMLAAPCCFLIRREDIAWYFSCAVALVCLLITFGLLHQFHVHGELSYELGGWAAPWGIEYRTDALTLIGLFIVSGVNLFAIVFARHSIDREIDSDRHSVFYAAWILAVCGMLGIVSTGDIFNVFVFLEISSLSSYVLIASASNNRALMASFRYLILGTTGATFFLIGVGLLYALTGTLNMADLAERLGDVRHTSTFAVAISFLVIGIALKMALFPLHSWMPDAYTYAPSPVSALLAGTTTKVSVYLLIRVLFDIVGVDTISDLYRIDLLLFPVALVAILVGSLAACWQQDAKRILAWSSIAQIGYMALGVSLITSTGLMAGMIHMFNHALMKAALFMAVGCIVWRIGSSSFDSLSGLGRVMPWTFSAVVLASLSLIGVPLTAGFISKWYLILALVENGHWLVVALVVISSILAAVYLGRLIEVLWFRQPTPETGTDQSGRRSEASLWLLGPTWALVIANFWFGISTTLPVGLANSAAASLLVVSP